MDIEQSYNKASTQREVIEHVSAQLAELIQSLGEAEHISKRYYSSYATGVVFTEYIKWVEHIKRDVDLILKY